MPDLSLYGFAHDLRQSLRTITLSVQRIQRQGEATGPETQARLEEILAAARTQEALIAGVVEYDEASEDEATRLLLPLAIQSACMKVDAYRKERGGTVRVGATVPAVHVDSGVAKVVEKLIHNSLKFVVGTPDVSVEVLEEDGVVIRVSDNGIGVEARYRELAFQPLKKLNSNSDYPGAGMGLAICKRVVERMGGGIDFEDAAAGTTVVVRLPA